MADELPPLTIACVLKTGPEYQVNHVLALHAGFQRHLWRPHRFVCLTDCGAVPAAAMERAGIEPIRLKHGWRGWWSKMELFRPGLFAGPVLYADLDTIIVGPLGDLVEGHHFTVLRSFWAKTPADPRIGSGLMAWNTELGLMYQQFRRGFQKAMGEYVTTERWGDQGFIKEHAPTAWEIWQDKFPGRVISYKKHVVPAGGAVPEGAAIICYHGQPRPWNTPLWHSVAA